MSSEQTQPKFSVPVAILTACLSLREPCNACAKAEGVCVVCEGRGWRPKVEVCEQHGVAYLIITELEIGTVITALRMMREPDLTPLYNFLGVPVGTELNWRVDRVLELSAAMGTLLQPVPGIFQPRF